MSVDTTTQPSSGAEQAARVTLYLTFATFAIVWLSLIAGAFLKVWTLAEVRDLIILLVGLQAGSLSANPIGIISRVVTKSAGLPEK